MKPFDHDVALDVAHTSANQFGHRSHDAGEIIISVFTALLP